jgi:hypothetical protein
MTDSADSAVATTRGASHVLAVVYWLVVGIPLAWGVYQTVQKSTPLFSVTATKVVAAPVANAAAMPP